MVKMGVACGRFARRRGVTGAHISRKTGLSQDKISRIFSGRSEMNASELMIVCDALGADPIEVKAEYEADKNELNAASAT